MNKALVEGQRTMNQASKDTSIEAFTSGFTKQYGLNMEGKKQDTLKNNRWADTVGTPDNILKVEEGDRDTVLDWNQGMRDKFVDAMKKFDESGDDKDKRIADEILIKVKNLDNQLGEFQLDKQKYLTDIGDLLPGQFDSEFYADNYTKNKASAYTIDDNGNIIFDDGSLFNERKGSYKLKNGVSLNAIDDMAAAATTQAINDGRGSNKNFNFNNVKNSLEKNFLSTGSEGVMVLSQTDLNENDNQVVSFATEYVNGALPDKVYALLEGSGVNDSVGPQSATQDGSNLKRDAKWMEDPGNRDLLANMMSTYVAGGIETVYEEQYGITFEEEAGKGFLSNAKGTVFSNLLRTTIDSGTSTKLYKMLETGNKEEITVQGTKIISNGDGTFTTKGIGNLVTKDMVESGAYNKNQLGNQISENYRNATELINKLGINDADFQRLEASVPGESADEVKVKVKTKLPTSKSIDFYDVFDGKFNQNRVSALEKQYPGLKMRTEGINSDFYFVSYKGGEEVEIEFNRATDKRNKTSQKLLNNLLKGI
tara:strand:- start:2333 stop:3946 length:1614 start_codon:yes stop_codon:yes gene_type:complete